MTANESRTPYKNIIGCISSLLADLSNQIKDLVVFLQKETENGKKDLPSLPDKSLRTAIISMQFNFLEALANALAVIALEANRKTAGAPGIKEPLSQIEIEFLAEKRSFLDSKTATLMTATMPLVPAIDRLGTIPVLLAKTFGISFQINKIHAGWQKIVKLKNMRDKLTHSFIAGAFSPGKEQRTDGRNYLNLFIAIQNRHLFEGSEAIRWYIQRVIMLLKQASVSEHQQLLNILSAADYSHWLIQLALYKSCGISDKDFNRTYQNTFESKLRRYDRLDTLNLLEFVVLDDQDYPVTRGMGRTLNISEKGVLMETFMPFALGQSLIVAVGLNEQIINLKGSVVRIHDSVEDVYKTGMEFMDINPADEARLHKYLQDVPSMDFN
ncbi:MAG: PilZ domain-containing protein [Proteobacteria bacterium]|nr:PilZ domain-containing protein [Pseudomonadota bacterium]